MNTKYILIPSFSHLANMSLGLCQGSVFVQNWKVQDEGNSHHFLELERQAMTGHFFMVVWQGGGRWCCVTKCVFISAWKWGKLPRGIAIFVVQEAWVGIVQQTGMGKALQVVGEQPEQCSLLLRSSLWTKLGRGRWTWELILANDFVLYSVGAERILEGFEPRLIRFARGPSKHLGLDWKSPGHLSFTLHSAPDHVGWLEKEHRP